MHERENMLVRRDSGHTLLIMLVASFILGLLFVLFLGGSNQSNEYTDVQPLNADGSQPGNRMEAYQADTDAARRTQNLLEQRSYEGFDTVGE